MVTKVDFSIDSDNASVTPAGGDYVKVELENVDLNELIQAIGEDEILAEFDIEDIIKNKGADDLLAEIGEEAARKYFDIEEE